MIFRATLRRGFPVWTAWRHRSAPLGDVNGVAFRWVPGDDYATGDLTADEVKRLHGNADVRLECFGGAVPGGEHPPVSPESDMTVLDAPRRGTPEWREREAARVRAWRKQRRHG